MLTIRTLSDLQQVLFNPPADLTADVYYVIRDAELVRGPEPNITIIVPHSIDHEYPKTLGHYHNHGEPETYRILYGEAALLIQKPNTDDYSEITELSLVRGRAGDVLKVPSGFGHCLINTGKEMLITADWEAETAGHVYDEIKRLHGFCYYLIEENGKIKTIRNKNYTKVPELTCP